MAILNIQANEPGQAGVVPRIIRIDTDNTVAEVTAAGYLNDAVRSGLVDFKESDLCAVTTKTSAAAAPNAGWYEISSAGGDWSLVPPAEPGAVVLPTVANQLVHATNTTGTLSSAPQDVTHDGDLTLQAGHDLKVSPPTASRGVLVLQATDNTGDTDVTITNSEHGQASVHNLVDPGVATAYIQTSATESDPCINMVSFDVTVGQADLATGGSVTLQASSGSKQYRIRELYLNSGGTDFSGGGGDRLATISDGTTDYSVIPAATLQSLANARFGDTGLPFPASAAINVSTAAGAALTIAYSGGTTDYAAGSMVISGVMERVA